MKRLIQFLSFDGCPLASRARSRLQEAPGRDVGVAMEEVDLYAPETPDDLRRWGLPTILVDGRDLTGKCPGIGLGCRVYAGPDGVPTVEQTVDLLTANDCHD